MNLHDIRKKIKPIFRNVRSYPAPYYRTVISSVSIPTSMKGEAVTFYAVVVEAGRKPPVRELSDL